MERVKLTLLALAALVMTLFSVGCSSDSTEQVSPTPVTPSVSLQADQSGETTLKFTLTPTNAQQVAWLCLSREEAIPTAEQILSRGNQASATAQTQQSVEGLNPDTEYLIVAAAKRDNTTATAQLRMRTTPAATPAKSHTLILFMQGDCGLEEFMDINLQRVISAYYELPETTQIAIFYDRGNYTRLTKLYMDDGMAKQQLIEEYKVSQSAVDTQFVQGVLERIKTELPADTYGIILSSHGGGWVPAEIYNDYIYHDWEGEQSPSAAPLFYGQDRDANMEIPALAEALSVLHFDYILFDACFMASVEGLYDLRNNADYIIASSAEVLGDGFPYQDILPLLFEADHGLQEACEAFMALYEGSSGTISLVKTSEFEGLAEAVRKVVAASDGTVDPEQIQGYEGFPIHLYYDLEQYVEQMTADETLRTEFRTALSKVLAYTNHTPSFISSVYKTMTIDLERSCGLTCHVEREEFPETHAAYLNTAWAKAIGAE